MAAGSVVTGDVGPGTVVGGNPAHFIYTTAALVERMEARSDTYPLRDMIQAPKGAFDAAMEPELVRMRQHAFYGELN